MQVSKLSLQPRLKALVSNVRTHTPLRFGYELECAVAHSEFNEFPTDDDEPPMDVIQTWLPEGYTHVGDGSIESSQYAPVEFNSAVYERNELPKALRDFATIAEHVKEVNNTMGLHVHVSFPDPKAFDRLCSVEFPRYFEQKFRESFIYEKNGRTVGRKELARLRNRYCRVPSETARDENNLLHEQITAAGKDQSRYTAVNYNAYQCHKTIEFRVFPATRNPAKFAKYLVFLFAVVDSYLEGHPLEPFSSVAEEKVQVQPEGEVEEVVISTDRVQHVLQLIENEPIAYRRCGACDSENPLSYRFCQRCAGVLRA